MKGKKGQIGISVMVAIMIFVVGMLAVNLIKPEVTRARAATGLNCASADTDGTRLACLIIDLTIPYFMIIVVSVAGGLITAKLLI